MIPACNITKGKSALANVEYLASYKGVGAQRRKGTGVKLKPFVFPAFSCLLNLGHDTSP